MTMFQKSQGLTSSEQYLASLCNQSFLSLWSYPNLFRDQGRKGPDGDGKELCDLLVVFGDHIVIFSDKSCRFPDTGDTQLDWCRWFNRSIYESAMQAYGAERWLRRYPDKIFMDAKCTTRLPLLLPPADRSRFHRVIIALNASDRCKQFFGGGNGSLVLRPGVSGGKPPLTPFTVGQIEPHKGYIHVLDDFTLDVILKELDTASDFIEYLSKKEMAMLSGKVREVFGEEELLAYYLTHWNNRDEHEFSLVNSKKSISLPRGRWNGLSRNLRYMAKKQADAESYRWDSFIELVISSSGQDGSPPIHAMEPGLRLMAGESRLARRWLGDKIRQIWTETPKNQPALEIVLSPRRSDVGYVLLLIPTEAVGDPANYQNSCLGMLIACCVVAVLRFPQLQYVVGIRGDPRSVPASEDTSGFAYVESRKLSEKLKETAPNFARMLFEVDKINLVSHFVPEYPDVLDGVVSISRGNGNEIVVKPIPITSNRKTRRAARAGRRRERPTAR
jgi:hypothetical protein